MSTQYILAHIFALFLVIAGYALLQAAALPDASTYTRQAGFVAGIISFSLGAFLLGQLHGPF